MNDDLISRQAAIKDAESWVAVDEYEKHLQKNVVEWLKEFPPAELGTNLAEVGTDCICRQQAIDALRTCYDTETISMDNGDEYINYGDAVGEIKQLPPIQPKLLQPWEVLVAQAVLPQPEIIRCKDCKHYWIHKCMDSMPIEICDLEQTFYDAEIDFCSLAERREVTT